MDLDEIAEGNGNEADMDVEQSNNDFAPILALAQLAQQANEVASAEVAANMPTTSAAAALNNEANVQANADVQNIEHSDAASSPNSDHDYFLELPFQLGDNRDAHDDSGLSRGSSSGEEAAPFVFNVENDNASSIDSDGDNVAGALPQNAAGNLIEGNPIVEILPGAVLNGNNFRVVDEQYENDEGERRPRPGDLGMFMNHHRGDRMLDADLEEPNSSRYRRYVAVRTDFLPRPSATSGNIMLHVRRALLRIGHGRRSARSGSYFRHINGERSADGDAAVDGSDSMEEDQAPCNPPAEDVEPENAERFDTNLPAEHSYLGDNLIRVSGVNYLEVGGTYNMILFMHNHIVFPGEILPLMISQAVTEANACTGLFGVCFPFMNRQNAQTLYGVTCQIYERGYDDDGNLVLKSRALQRFVTTPDTQTENIQFISENPQLVRGFVKILPEIDLREPLQCVNMGSMNRLRDISGLSATYKRYQMATTPFPPHVFDEYDMSSIIEKARKLLAQKNIDNMPTDSVSRSFWLARNLHLPESLLITIFMTDTVNQRLKIIDSTLLDVSVYVCRICSNRIALCSELFAMSKHGVQTQYCNSSGYVHETSTVHSLVPDAVRYSGAASSEYSWFPGYEWHIIVCKVCTRHIGWQFKATKPNLVPKTFFCISSNSVRVSDAKHKPGNARDEILRNFARITRGQVQ